MPSSANRALVCLVVVCLGSCMLPAVCLGGGASPWEAGVRSGFTFFNRGKNFEPVDLFLRRDLPFDWQSPGHGVRLGMRGEGAVGLLIGDNGREGMTASLGPDLVLGLFHDRLRFHAGTHLALLSRSDYGYRNFGGPFQFMNHLGLSLRVTDRLVVGYRFQHMSNADIYRSNPGLNTNMLELSLRL